MMQTLILTFGLLALAMLGLGLGVLFSRAPLKGSCGGLACDNACHACPKSVQKRTPAEKRTGMYT